MRTHDVGRYVKFSENSSRNQRGIPLTKLQHSIDRSDVLETDCSMNTGESICYGNLESSYLRKSFTCSYS